MNTKRNVEYRRVTQPMVQIDGLADQIDGLTEAGLKGGETIQ